MPTPTHELRLLKTDCRRVRELVPTRLEKVVELPLSQFRENDMIMKRNYSNFWNISEHSTTKQHSDSKHHQNYRIY